MSSATIAVAALSSAPPTVAAVLAYLSARGARRAASRDQTGQLVRGVAALATGVRRTRLGVDRCEASLLDVRERVAHIEGQLESWATP